MFPTKTSLKTFSTHIYQIIFQYREATDCKCMGCNMQKILHHFSTRNHIPLPNNSCYWHCTCFQELNNVVIFFKDLSLLLIAPSFYPTFDALGWKTHMVWDLICIKFCSLKNCKYSFWSYQLSVCSLHWNRTIANDREC